MYFYQTVSNTIISIYRKCYHHHTLSAACCLKTLVRASSCSITLILIVTIKDAVSGITAIVNLHFVGDFWGHKCLSCVTLCETSAQTLLCFPLGQRKRQKNETLNSSIRLLSDFQCPYLFIVLMNTAWAHSLHRSWKPDEAEMLIDLSALHTYSSLDWDYITHKYFCVYLWKRDVLVVLGSTSAKSTFMLFCSYIVLLIFLDKYWNEIDVLFFLWQSHVLLGTGFTFSDSCSSNNSIQCCELQHN